MCEFLPPADGLRLARACRCLADLRPRCLHKQSAGLWCPQGLTALSLRSLQRADDQICGCLQWVQRGTDDQICGGQTARRGARSKFRAVYISGGGCFISVPGSDEMGLHASSRGAAAAKEAEEWVRDEGWEMEGGFNFTHVFRTPAEMAQRCDLFVAAEITSRVVSLPEPLAQRLGTADPEMLQQLGLEGWSLLHESPPPSKPWRRLVFSKPGPQPLLLWHMEAIFDLPGGDGDFSVNMGFLDTSLKFHLTHRDFCEYPVLRYFKTAEASTWAETQQLFEASKRGSWEAGKWHVHSSGMLRTDWTGLNVVDAPCLSSAYADAAELANQHVSHEASCEG